MDTIRMLEMLDRHLAGEATAEESARVRAWLAADPLRAALIESLAQAPGREDDTDTAWRALRDRIREAPVEPRAGARAWLRAAAVAALLIVASLFWRSDSLTRRASPGFAPVVATAAAETATVQLSDGSEVTLAPGSRVDTAVTFGTGVRSVLASGEVFFRVTRDPRPFRVTAGDIISEVLGTAFAIRTFDSGAARIVVAEGRVAVTSRRDSVAPVVLEAGGVAALGPDGRLEHQPGSDPTRYLAWLTRTLMFEDAPLGEVLEEIERWFDVETRADEALLERRVTAQFSSDSLEAVLGALSLAIGASWSRDGRTVSLTAR
ncbi:MAG: FecR domain-containing protein [Gemmatimonadetes bacterium]|nr:FecR domain-containing protein [Gemmatimonadota bacterium]